MKTLTLIQSVRRRADSVVNLKVIPNTSYYQRLFNDIKAITLYIGEKRQSLCELNRLFKNIIKDFTPEAFNELVIKFDKAYETFLEVYVPDEEVKQYEFWKNKLAVEFNQNDYDVSVNSQSVITKEKREEHQYQVDYKKYQGGINETTKCLPTSNEIDYYSLIRCPVITTIKYNSRLKIENAKKLYDYLMLVNQKLIVLNVKNVKDKYGSIQNCIDQYLNENKDEVQVMSKIVHSPLDANIALVWVANNESIKNICQNSKYEWNILGIDSKEYIW